MFLWKFINNKLGFLNIILGFFFFKDFIFKWIENIICWWLLNVGLKGMIFYVWLVRGYNLNWNCLDSLVWKLYIYNMVVLLFFVYLEDLDIEKSFNKIIDFVFVSWFYKYN